MEFKGRMMTLTVLRPMTAELDRIEAELEERLTRAPHFYQDMPLLLEPAESAVDVGALASLARRLGMVPVAVCGDENELGEVARQAGLGVIPAAHGEIGKTSARQSRSADEPESGATCAAGSARPAARVETEVVRSGQRIYARGTDLVVMNAVSPGAEIIADGCIHVYGPLRGRALAGARGDADARIFCQSLEAELLAIAGQYRVADDMDENLRRQPARIQLNGDALDIAPLRTSKHSH